MRLLGNHLGLEAGEHVDRFFAVDPTVEHRELLPGEMLAELDLKLTRIRRGGRARTGAIGRRGTDGYNLDRLAACETYRGPRQGTVKTSLVSERIAFGGGRYGRRRGRRQR